MDAVVSSLRLLVKTTKSTKSIRKKFLERVNRENLTREENPQSHFCVYFAIHDPKDKKVFIGHHKKSGLWLFNGGHIEERELPEEAVIREIHEELSPKITFGKVLKPALLTLTRIEHPERIICEWHYDIWYFLPFSEKAFHPDEKLLATEFFSWGWKSYREARKLMRDPNSSTVLVVLFSAKAN